MLPPPLEHAADDVEVVEDGQKDQQLVEDAVHLALKMQWKFSSLTFIVSF